MACRRVCRNCGRTPFWHAACANSQEVVKLLLQAGTFANLASDEGLSPVHVTYREDQAESLTAMLEGGASPNLATAEIPLAEPVRGHAVGQRAADARRASGSLKAPMVWRGMSARTSESRAGLSWAHRDMCNSEGIAMSEEQDLSVREKLLLMEAVTCGTHVIVTF